MKTFIVTLATIFILAIFLGIVIADDMGHEKEEQHMKQSQMMPRMRGGSMIISMFTPQMLLPLADELNLKEEQIKSIQKIGVNLQKEVIRKNADRSVAELELNALLNQEEIDFEQARRKIQQIANLNGELRVAQIKALIDTKEVLTTEQRGLFLAWISQSERYGMGGGMHENRSYSSDGERIYYTATNDSGQKIPFSEGPPWLRMMGGSCVNCHGVDGKGGIPIMMSPMVAPDITYQFLTSGEHEHEHENEHEEATYTDELIKRAITDGIGASGHKLSKIMPRWDMSEEDLDDLLKYLQTLGE